MQTQRLSWRNRGLIVWIVVFCSVSLAIVSSPWPACAEEEKIDPSKPTNFYTQLQNSAEYVRLKGGTNLIGYRANITWTDATANHLILGEVPLLYNDATEKFGLADLRARYFGIIYKDYSKFLGVAAPSLDIFFPTGKFEDGLGSSRWRVSPGIAVGFIFNATVSTFPVLSYQFQSKPTTDAIPDNLKEIEHGATLQFITPIRLNETTTLELTPWFIANNVNRPEEDDFVLITRIYKVIENKYQIGGNVNYAFNAETTTVRAFLVVFL